MPYKPKFSDHGTLTIYYRCRRCGIDVSPSSKWGATCRDCSSFERREETARRRAAELAATPPKPRKPQPKKRHRPRRDRIVDTRWIEQQQEAARQVLASLR